MTLAFLLLFQFVCHVCLPTTTNAICEIQAKISIVSKPHQHPVPLFNGN